MNLKMLRILSLLPFMIPLYLKAQTPNPTPGDEGSSPMEQEIKSAQEELGELTEERSEISLEYNHQLRMNLEELMRLEAQRIRKEGDGPKADLLLKEIDRWEAVRNSEFEKDLLLLDKKNHLQQLNLDHVGEFYQKMSDKLQSQGQTQQAEEFKGEIQLVQQMKSLENQALDLNKQLLLCRHKYDFVSSIGIRKRQKDLQDQINDLMKKMNVKMKPMQSNQEFEEQNL